MNSAHFLRVFAVFAPALILVTPHDASAVDLNTVVGNIHQIGMTAGVSLGHAAIGHTNYNRITVSGAYTTACASPLMTPTSGQRTLSREEILGGFGLVTTVPERLPTIVDLPGFELLAAGSRIACAYNWTSKAVESSYSIGIPGFGLQTGSGERSQGGTWPFVMAVPAADDSDDDDGCA